ncbi:MAG: hypothetical protein CMD74_03320 [Gammaproteobacteria bacterium]|nr:hypothetical protein [Gammaproteobacteria bacterium]
MHCVLKGSKNLYIYIVLAITSLIWFSPVIAEPVDWLYEVEVRVPDQTVNSRTIAEKKALNELLTRLSGLRDIPSVSAIDSALLRPDRYYRAFYYTTGTSKSGGEGLPETSLKVEFDPGIVLDLLKSADLPIWRADRPKVICWVVFDFLDGREIAASADSSEFTTALQKRALERGLPLVLPLMDLEDRLSVDPAAILGRFEKVLWTASERYQPDAILLGRVQTLPNERWVVDWQLLIGKDEPIIFAKSEDIAGISPVDIQDISAMSTTLPILAANGVDFVADELAKRFSVLGDLDNDITLSVYSLQGLEAYSSLLKYLGELEVVDAVDVQQISEDRIILGIETQADKLQLLQMFEQDNSLFPIKTSLRNGFRDSDLELMWRHD